MLPSIAIDAAPFSLDEAERAFDAWTFNCGPAALAAVLNLTPAQVRPFMGDFETKGYTNPTLMLECLQRAGARFRQVYRGDKPACVPPIDLGLMRVQWTGPWTKPGVPIAARYRVTHWVGLRNQSKEVFDVNAMCVGGWIPYAEWSQELVPWLIREMYPKADGGWWPTHVLEVMHG